MNSIRKISVGSGFPDKCVHYQVGRNVSGKTDYIISHIVVDTEAFKFDKLIYNIYISGNNETLIWKAISDVPVVVEYNIDFE